MKKILMIGICLVMFQANISAQSGGDFMIGAGMDLYRTDNDGIADKFQIGFEANYFLINQLSFTGGLDFWTGAQDDFFIVLGTRFYPIKPVFIRFRGLIADPAELALGMGYAHRIARNWRLEGAGDYYFNLSDLGIRFSVHYIF